MSRKKTAVARLSYPHTSTPRRTPEQNAFVDYFLSTVCDPSRRSILELLSEPSAKDPSVLYERRSGEIAQALGLSNATISEHLHQLADLHLVMTRKQGTAVYYRLSNHLLVQAFLDLLGILDLQYQKQSS